MYEKSTNQTFSTFARRMGDQKNISHPLSHCSTLHLIISPLVCKTLRGVHTDLERVYHASIISLKQVTCFMSSDENISYNLTVY